MKKNGSKKARNDDELSKSIFLQGVRFQRNSSQASRFFIVISFSQAIFLSLFCQALSISQTLNLSLSLRDRDRADTIISFHHHHHHQKLFKHLEMTYSRYGIRSDFAHFLVFRPQIGLIGLVCQSQMIARIVTMSKLTF